MTYNRVVGLKKINFDLFVSCIRFPIACYQIVIWLQDELNMIMICPELIDKILSNGSSSSGSSGSSNGSSNFGNSGSNNATTSNTSNNNNSKVDKNATNNNHNHHNHDKNNNTNTNDDSNNDDDDDDDNNYSTFNKYLLSTKTFLHAKYIGCQRYKKVPNVDLDLIKNYLIV